MTTLALAEAKEFGNAMRFIRDARRMTVRELCAASGVSYQYIHNIESAERTGPSDDVAQRLQRAYRLPEREIEDLLLRARVRSALLHRGISKADADAAWKMMERRLVELGVKVSTDMPQILATILIGAAR